MIEAKGLGGQWMVQLIIGEKGKGKTVELLAKVNEAVKNAKGNLVYIDKNTRHMHELSNKVRLINATEYPITNADEFLGFVCGIISQDYDLEQMYLDSFLGITSLNGKEIVDSNVLEKLDKISSQFKVDFIISMSVVEEELPEAMKSNVIIAL